MVVQAPADLAVNGHSESFGLDVRAVIAVNDSINITISGIDVDGNFAGDTTDGGSDEFTGIGYFNSSGSIDDVDIGNVGNSQGDAAFGLPQGSGLFIDGGNTPGLEVSVTDSSITDFQKNGALIYGVTINFTGNTITGIGGTDLLAQNGLQIGNSQGVIDGNTITGLGYSGGILSATGIFAYEPTGPLAITDNIVTGAGAAGSAVGLDLSDVQGISVEVTGNSFSDLDFGISAYSFVGGTIGLDTDPLISGNTFSGILELGIYFAPEELILDDFTTTESFAQSGTQFDDYLAGSLGDDSFSGQAGDDALLGNGGDDLLEGGADDDYLIGGGGDDALDGGSDIDTAVYTGFVSDYVISVETNSDGFVTGFTDVTDIGSGYDEGSDTLTGIERLVFFDTLIDLADPVQLFDPNGNLVQTFATIQAAIDGAPDDYIIRVAAGTYVEDLVIHAGVTILGTGAGDAVAGRDSAGGVGETTIVGHAQITATDNVTLDGLRFLNDTTTTAPTVSVLTGGGVDGHLITNSIFWSTIAGGANGVDDRAISISPIASGLVTVTDNLISGTSQGQFGTASWGRGIWFDGGGVALVVNGNTFEWTRSGLNLDMSGSSTADISNNVFRGLGTGVAVGVDADGLTISDNDIERVNEEFNFRNLSTNVTFNAGAAIGVLTLVGDFNDPIVVLGGSGNDTFDGTGGVDVLDGNNSPSNPGAADTDILNGLGGNDFLFGRGGNDMLDGGTGDDAMTGGTGNDVYVVDSTGDSVIEAAGEGTDEVRTALATYTLAAALENLTGLGNVNQTLNGNASNNIIDGGLGADTMTGGAGNDTYVVDNVGDTVIELAGEGTDEIRTNLDFYSLAGLPNVENLTGTSANPQFLVGNGSANVIRGGQSNDYLDGGLGADTMVGGDGNDYYWVDNVGDVVVELAGEGPIDLINTTLATYSLFGTEVEQLLAGSNINHDFRGSTANNHIAGGSGNDFIRLQDGGNDRALGGAGNDVFLFGSTMDGLDEVDGDIGTDQIALQGGVAFTFGSGVVGIESLGLLSGSDTRFGDPGGHLYSYDLTTREVNVASGVQLVVDGAKLLIGENLTFNGAAENDGSFFIYGGRGVDTLMGGAKNDVFLFGSDNHFGASDVVNGGSAGTDQLALRGSYTLTFGAGQLIGIESLGLLSAFDTRFGALGSNYSYNLTTHDNNVAGGVQMTVDGAKLRGLETLVFNGAAEMNGSFRIFGGINGDTLTGSQNGDILQGSGGADNLRGGGGADGFRYLAASDSATGAVDHILDFTTGLDKIDLSRIDANTIAAADQAFNWIGSNAFSNVAGQLRAFQQGGDWILQGDINGDGVADLVIALTLQGPTPLSANDFVL